MRSVCVWTVWVVFVALGIQVVGAEASKNEKHAWVSLSGDRGIQGWTPLLETEVFKAVGDEIHLKSSVNVWVASDLELGDFIFEGEAMIPDDASEKFNSGFAFRCVGREKKPKGYQCEIDGANPGNEGGVYAIGMGGWLYPKEETKAEHQSRIKSAYKAGEWNHYRVHAKGPRIRTYVNGELISDVRHEGSLHGYFAIQHHGRDGVMRFRHLRAKNLEEKRESK